MPRLADKGQRTIRVLNYNFFLYWNYCFAVFVRQQQLLTLSRGPLYWQKGQVVAHDHSPPSAAIGNL